MAVTVLPKPDPAAFSRLMEVQGLALRAGDTVPRDREAWLTRKRRLREAMFKAMGPFPETPLPLEPQTIGVLKRDGYRVEKIIFQSRPDVWVTGSAYVPQITGKVPAVLVVHGHWPFARRDPVVQARCLGLVKLGFFVLAVDAFGAGERFTKPAKGTYHGALYGSPLWPAGHTLLGMQVYDNRRAVDYLVSRPEVDGSKLGITGASGGGNQSMYAGALDERFGAVVPVCSVGTYQSYLQAACCVCEVLPGGLTLAEEGEILGLVAPRALLVINATKDGIQFSVAESSKSLIRARQIFNLFNAKDKIYHGIFESPHAYNQAMREAMYGWMTRWLKGEGDGKPIPEPSHSLDTPEDLACFPTAARPAGFLYPPTFAAREGRSLLDKTYAKKPTHVEEWDSAAAFLRSQLRKDILGEFPKAPRPVSKMGRSTVEKDVATTPFSLTPEPGMPLPVLLVSRVAAQGPAPTCVLLHLDGKAAAVAHPLTAALLRRQWTVLAPDLGATGETKPDKDGIAEAPDHNSAEHGLWVGRPLLGQWVFDIQCLLDWIALQPSLNGRRIAVVGLGQAGLVALTAAAALEGRIQSVGTVGGHSTLITESAYADGTRMGLLAPNLLRVGDVAQIAALAAPRRLVLVDGVNPQGRRQTQRDLGQAFAFTTSIYGLYRQEPRLTIQTELPMNALADTL